MIFLYVKGLFIIKNKKLKKSFGGTSVIYVSLCEKEKLLLHNNI